MDDSKTNFIGFDKKNINIEANKAPEELYLFPFFASSIFFRIY